MTRFSELKAIAQKLSALHKRRHLKPMDFPIEDVIASLRDEALQHRHNPARVKKMVGNATGHPAADCLWCWVASNKQPWMDQDGGWLVLSRKELREVAVFSNQIIEALGEGKTIIGADDDCPPPVYQLRISLIGTRPQVWRRIEISSNATLWDLHSAITDAMGWTVGSHYHVFQVGATRVAGRPTNDAPFTPPSWEQAFQSYCPDVRACQYIRGWPYCYDLGNERVWLNPDGSEIEDATPRTEEWRHRVVIEDVLDGDAKATYPRCVAGENACPPEGCGGIEGYRRFLKSIRNPMAADHKEQLKMVGGSFDPRWFDVDLVRFDDPQVRWQCMIDGKALPKTMRRVQYHQMRKSAGM